METVTNLMQINNRLFSIKTECILLLLFFFFIIFNITNYAIFLFIYLTSNYWHQYYVNSFLEDFIEDFQV